jgi:hypothetical protein
VRHGNRGLRIEIELNVFGNCWITLADGDDSGGRPADPAKQLATTNAAPLIFTLRWRCREFLLGSRENHPWDCWPTRKGESSVADARDLSAAELFQLCLEVSANEAEDLLQPRQLRRLTPFGEHQTDMERADLTPFANFLPLLKALASVLQQFGASSSQPSTNNWSTNVSTIYAFERHTT